MIESHRAAHKKFVGTWEGKAEAGDVRFYLYDVDYDFLRSCGIPVKAGRFFSAEKRSNRSVKIFAFYRAGGRPSPADSF